MAIVSYDNFGSRKSTSHKKKKESVITSPVTPQIKIPEVNSARTAATPYQMNLASNQPVKQEKKQEGLNDVLGKVMTMGSSQDQRQQKFAVAAMKTLTNEFSNPNSKAYNPYLKATNTSGVSAETVTQKAEIEAASVKHEIDYWVNRKDRNLSDDEVMKKVYQNFDSKYPTIVAMRNGADTGNPVQLDKPVTFVTDDWMKSQIWAARNDGGTGNELQDRAMSALGEGKQWKEDPDITARLDVNNKGTYAPYTVGSTLEEEGVYYGVPSFPKWWAESHLPDENNPTDVRMWNNVVKAEKFTANAEEEQEALDGWLDRILISAVNPEEVLKKADTKIKKEFKSLKAMDDSTKRVDQLIGTTRPIRYSRPDLIKKVQDICAQNNQKLTGQETVEENGGSVITEQTKETIKTTDDTIRKAYYQLEDALTDTEKNVLTYAGSSVFSQVLNGLNSIPGVDLATHNQKNISKAFVTDALPLYDLAERNATAKEQLDILNGYNAEKLNSNPELYERLDSIANDPEKLEEISEWMNIYHDSGDNFSPTQYSSAVEELYYYLSGENDLVYTLDQDRKESVKEMVDYLEQKTSGVETPFILAGDKQMKADLEEEIAATEGAQEKLNEQIAFLQQRIDIYEKAGIDTAKMKRAATVFSVLPYFSESQKKEWNTYNAYDMMIRSVEGGASYEDVRVQSYKKFFEELENLETAKFIKEYVADMGIELPENYAKNLDSYIEQKERLRTDYDYFVIQGKDDFEQKAEEGRKIAEANKTTREVRGPGGHTYTTGQEETVLHMNPMDGDLAGYFTDTERKTYYYLLATQGENAALQYFNYMTDGEYSVIQNRMTEAAENFGENTVNSGFWGTLGANALSILAAPAEGIMGGLYFLSTALTGQEYNPKNWMLATGHFSQKVYEQTSNNIRDSLEGHDVLKELALGAYDIAYNRLRSTTNAVLTGGLDIGGKFGSVLNEIVGALPMAAGAASMAIADAIEKNTDVGTAYLIGGITLVMESFTEGITRGNIEEALHGKTDLSGMKDILINWLTDAGFDESLGETLTEIVESEADKYLVPESDHKELVDFYLEEMGATRNDLKALQKAEAMASIEEYSSFVRTAVISYLSPGADTVTSAIKNGVHDFHEIRKATKKMQRLGFNVSMKEVREGYHAEKRNATSKAQNTAPEIKGGAVRLSLNPIEQNLLDSLGKLDAVASSDVSTQTAAITAVFGEQEGTSGGDMAKAAASNMRAVFGTQENTVSSLKNILQSAVSGKADLGQVRRAIQTAALSPSSEARQAVNSEAFQNGTAQTQAQMLAATVAADQGNKTVTTEIANNVLEARIAEKEKLILSSGVSALDGPEARLQNADDALAKAEEDLQAKMDERKAKTDANTAAAQEFAQTPTTTNMNIVSRTRGELDKAVTVEQEYTQHQAKSQADQEEAQNEYDSAKGAMMKDVRQQAEAMVAEEDQTRKQVELDKQAEAERIKKEKADALAKEQELSADEGKQEEIIREKQRKAIRDSLQARGYTGENLEKQVEAVMQRSLEVGRRRVDTKARLSEKDGDKFIRKISRTTGLQFAMADLGDPIMNRGYITDRNEIVLNSNLTVGQALVEAALHEITHGLEETEAYGKYASYVLNAMYGGEDTEEYQNALTAKMAEYASRNMPLSETGARYELVAEYARENMANKEFVRGMVSQGIGSKLRDVFYKAVNMLNGYKLYGNDRAQYEQIKTAVKLLNEAINERAEHMEQSNNGHTGLVQASITGWTDATGLTFEVRDNDSRVYKLYKDGKEIKPGEYTADMVKGTPVGNLIDMAGKSRQTLLDNKLKNGKITQEEYDAQVADLQKTAEQQRDYVSKIINMIGQYQDAAMVWELSGSLAFSSLKTNGDPQYSDSYDFGTICTKTNAILNVISETQVRLGRALTKEEIDGVVYYETGMGVQDENGNWKHAATPCPPCYVYATWVNKPARLERVRLYQQECANWTDEQINEFMNRPDPVGKSKAKTKELKTEQNTKKLWISLCLADQVTDPDTGRVSWVRKENPDICPNEILLDLRRSGDMATQYAGTWAFMQKGGNAQGKAIAPYSDARLGESIVAKAIGAGEANARLLEDERNAGNDDYIPQFLNPFLSLDPNDQGKAAEYFEKAIKKVKAQNLKGGQRWQSWSDFRAEWGSDYLMEMITMQALGSQVQTYTKVSEAIDLLASAGFEVNMSLMPHGDGFWHNDDGSIKIDEDGNMMLRFSNVTGINPEAAEQFAKKYGTNGNVQPMVVGISDAHIKSALAGDYITFVIPFHGSGGSVKRLQNLMSLLGEQMKTGNDYTKVQSDNFAEYEEIGEGKAKKKINTNPNWKLREAILTGNYDALETDEKEAIAANPYLKKLYEDRYINEDSDAFEVFFSKSEAQQIYPYEYWDTNTTMATSDINSRRFIEYCQMLGVVPRFSGETRKATKGKYFTEEQYGDCDPSKMTYDKKGRVISYEFGNFSGRTVDENGNVTYNPVKNYWKLLIDRPMYNRVYDENGKMLKDQCTYHKPQAVSTAGINVGAMPKAANNTVGHSDDETRQITERIIQRLQMTSAQNAAAGSATDLQQNQKTLQGVIQEGVTKQNSSGGNLTGAEMDMVLHEVGLINAEDAPYSNLPSTPANLPELPADEGGNAQRQFGYQTAQGSDALHQEVKDYLYTHSSYTPDSNREQIDRSIAWVQSKATENDPDGYRTAIDEVTSDTFDYRSADGQARMLTVMSMAALKNDVQTEMRIADSFNKQGTDLGRQLQARKIFRMMTPVGRQATLQGMVRQINEDFAKNGSTDRVTLSEDIIKAAAEADTEEKFGKVRKDAVKELAAQLPANWKDKLTGWRMLSMLGNPRTHIRNILGNALFMPVVGMKNKVGAVFEIASGYGKYEGRTKTIGFATKDAREFAKKDALAMKDELTGEAKYNDGSLIQQNRKTWGTGKGMISKTLGKTLQAASDFNSWALEAEDWVFLNRHYRNALAGYMTANKLTSSEMTGKTLEKAREYASLEAQKATYRDFSALASWLSNPNAKGKELKGTKFVINAALPFKKTPINILKRGVEYSPVGLIKSLTTDMYHLKQWGDYREGKLSALPEKAISPTQWIDKFASGLTGTGITILGALLASTGAIKAGFNDKDPDDQYDKERGKQEYSLNFNILGQDVSMTIDWAAPMSMPLFVGASIYDAVSSLTDGENVDIAEIASSIASITEPVFNLSMLDGVNSLLDVNNYSEGNAITKIGEKLLSNYASSYVPTLSGQLARTIDTTRRKAYVESGAALSNERYEWEKIENKIPFLSKSNIPYRNVWGETSEKTTVAAALENFLSPAYFNQIRDDEILDEMQRLYNAQPNITSETEGALKVKMPSKGDLNAEEYDRLTVERGQKAKQFLGELMNSEAYAFADDENRAEMVADVWTFCNQRANNLVSGKAVDQWVATVGIGGNPVDAVINRAVERNKKEQKEGFSKQLKSSVTSGNLENAQTAIAGLRRTGKQDKDIKSSITETVKPLYQKAYLDGDLVKIGEITDMLNGLDSAIKWDEKTLNGWVKGLDNQKSDEEEEENEPIDYSWLNRNYR